MGFLRRLLLGINKQEEKEAMEFANAVLKAVDDNPDDKEARTAAIKQAVDKWNNKSQMADETQPEHEDER